MRTRAAVLRTLPSVDRLLRHPVAAALLARYPRPLVTATLRSVLDDARVAVDTAATARVPGAESLLTCAAERLRDTATPRLQPAINASGVVLHTNLGRAALAPEAVAALTAVADQASNLEYDLASGARSERDAHVEAHLCALTGADAAAVVNNNAAALLLALNTLADGKEVVVSRGELIEIGGSFRIPEILAKSGGRLREVGTTNRTHAHDYESAIGPNTGVLLKVHTSNYRLVGFTASVSLETLVGLGRKHRVPIVEDLGSGALVDLSAYGLPHEPVVADRVRLGADIVTFSGDKLLGGPQAGVLVGRRDVIECVRRNPLKRALRCDKLTIAAFEATLRLYRTSNDLAAALPTLRYLTRSIDKLEQVGRAAIPLIEAALGARFCVEIIDAHTEIGSGALPTESLPTKAIAITHPEIQPLEIAATFRASRPPIIGRVHANRFCLDLRCIDAPEQLVPSIGRT